jgi:hypothetical protein
VTIIDVAAVVGDFAGDKDTARAIRRDRLAPALERGEHVRLDFQGVELATQSFIHALVGELIRSEEFDALDLITFLNCNDSVKEMVEIVAEYTQEDVTSGEDAPAGGHP